MKTLLLALLYLSASSFAQAVDSKGFTALAYSENTGNYGWVTSLQTREEAVDKALSECKNKGCEVMVVLRNGCAAFAQNDRARGWAVSDTLDEAQRSAVKECQNYAKGPVICEVKASGCTIR